jgi:hypothetical protein
MGMAIIRTKTGNTYIEFPFVSTNDMTLPDRKVGFETNLSGQVLATDFGYNESNREIVLNFSTDTNIKNALEIAAKDNSDSYIFSDGTNEWDILIMGFDARYKDRGIFDITMTIRCMVQNV